MVRPIRDDHLPKKVDMEKNKEEVNADFRGITDKMESGKVKYMVGTFLNEDNNGVQVQATQKVAEKVDATVYTFLNRDSNCLKITRLMTKKIETDRWILKSR
ncbi:hypothetical protein [Emticicia fontis]